MSLDGKVAVIIGDGQGIGLGLGSDNIRVNAIARGWIRSNLSNDSTFVTGQVIVIDGGRTSKLPLPF